MSDLDRDEARYLAMLARAAGERAAERAAAREAEARQAATPWYAVQTAPRAEWLAAGRLGRGGAALFLPYRLASVRRGRREVGVSRPLFPGYLFARIAEGRMLAAAEAEGVLGVVRFGEAYAVVPDRAVEALMGACDALGCLRTAVSRDAQGGDEVVRWALGEMVRIIGGPFVGFTGEVVAVDAAGRIALDIDIFGRSTPVSLSEADVEAARPPGGRSGPRSRRRRGARPR